MRRCAGYVGYEEGGNLTETVRRKPYKLRPEFVNRIDEIVAFHSLDEKNIRSIAKIQMRYLEERLGKLEMKLVVSNTVMAKLAEAGFDPVYGTRPLKRAIQTSIENPLAKKIVSPGYTTHFEGWTKEESRPLLEYLFRHAENPEFFCRFRWEPGSMAFWDNYQTWHYAVNDYDSGERIMHRIVVNGPPFER